MAANLDGVSSDDLMGATMQLQFAEPSPNLRAFVSTTGTSGAFVGHLGGADFQAGYFHSTTWRAHPKADGRDRQKLQYTQVTSILCIKEDGATTAQSQWAMSAQNIYAHHNYAHILVAESTEISAQCRNCIRTLPRVDRYALDPSLQPARDYDGTAPIVFTSRASTGYVGCDDPAEQLLAVQLKGLRVLAAGWWTPEFLILSNLEVLRSSSFEQVYNGSHTVAIKPVSLTKTRTLSLILRC
ncbi:hypothetical protein AC579_5495 [Pseudocercospora musae]|uniref:Uncharacterized protein n=1 Tax=Pseudocercospora musae TaxID=113226 RepID=A0A139IPZ2_9PEZI|nr:hypothetical protein AC579_5495 [Pseudocercospora musae]